MRRLVALSVLAAVAATVAYAQDNKPINAKCPVKGDAVNPGITADYEGKVIGFC